MNAAYVKTREDLLAALKAFAAEMNNDVRFEAEVKACVDEVQPYRLGGGGRYGPNLKSTPEPDHKLGY